MKLDMDCVRDILLAVESATLEDRITIDWLAERLPAHTSGELQYTGLKLGEGGFLNLITVEMQGSYLPGIKVICDMTYQGHELLSNIRTPTNWAKTKEIGGKIGAFGLRNCIHKRKRQW